MNKLLALNVTGKNHDWCFMVRQDPKHMKDWLDDGLDIKEVSMDARIVPCPSYKMLYVAIKGNGKTWSFNFLGPEDALDLWADDGLDVGIVESSEPA